MDLKRIAVLMSTYNGEKYIQEQIDSILNQKGEFELDLWVRDDGSKDGTWTILQNYVNEGKLRCHIGENLRPAHSFMDLIMHCSSYDFYAFADQDDYWMPDKLERGIKAIGDQKKLVLYFSNVRLVDAELKDLGRNAYKKIPPTDFYTLSCAGGLLGCTMVFNEALAEVIRNRPVPQKIVMHDFYIALVCLALNGDIIYEAEPSMKYRQHRANVVGVSHSFLGKVKSRMRDITRKAPVSIAEQAEAVLNAYGNEMDNKKTEWLQTVAEYKNGIVCKIQLAISNRVKYINSNMGFKNRLAILLGNR